MKVIALVLLFCYVGSARTQFTIGDELEIFAALEVHDQDVGSARPEPTYQPSIQPSIELRPRLKDEVLNVAEMFVEDVKKFMKGDELEKIAAVEVHDQDVGSARPEPTYQPSIQPSIELRPRLKDEVLNVAEMFVEDVKKFMKGDELEKIAAVEVHDQAIRRPSELDTHRPAAVKSAEDSSEEYHVDTPVKRSAELSDSALNNALKGYDIVHGEPFSVLDGNSADPGLKLQIFKDGDHVEVSKITKCTMTADTEIVTSLNQFRRATGESSVTGSGIGFEKSGTVAISDPSGTVSAETDYETSADVAFSNSESSQQVADHFTETKGGLALEQATCIIDKVVITTILLPDFTEIFKQAVRDLANAPEAQRTAAFKTFVTHFGSHFIVEAELGARLMLSTFLSADARHDFTGEQIQACSSKQGGFSMFGLSVDSSSEQCSSSDESSFNSGGNYVTKVVVHSYGSKPASTAAAWAASDFDPLPIKMKLKPIYELFDPKHLDRQGMGVNDANGVNGEVLGRWFNEKYSNYCETMGFECGKMSKKGCGYTDNCQVQEDCVDVDLDLGTTKCVLNGRWSAWTDWGSCSKTCGAGSQTRSRQCEPPASQRTGDNSNCDGKESEVQTQECRKVEQCTGVLSTACSWKNGKWGETIGCDPGYVAAGACGSGSKADCGSGYHERLYCCKIKGNTAPVRPKCSASIYQHTSYGGKVNTYYQNRVSLYRDNDLTSIKVHGAGCCATVYWDKKYRGNRNNFCGNSYNVGSTWNDKASSIRINQPGCHLKQMRNGKEDSCSGGEFVTSSCGSGNNGDCGHYIWNEITCCPVPGWQVDAADCAWKWGDHGQYLYCPSERPVVMGRCGSGAKDDCHNSDYYHGIRCCSFKSKD